MEVSQKPFAAKKPDQLVYLELDSGNGGMLLSVSEQGFRFRAVSPLRPGPSVPFAFSFDGKHRLQGVGEIEWLDEDAKSGGMRFTEVSDEFRAALRQWLASESRHDSSGREVTPAASAPLDTMEKIREELRRGYPGASRPAPPAQKGSSPKSKIPSAKKETPPPEPEAAVAEPEPESTESQQASSPRATPDRTPSPRAAEPTGQRSQPGFRPPFSRQAVPPTPAESAPAHSAFLKMPRETPPAPSVPAPVASTPSTSAAPEPAPQLPIPPALAPRSLAPPAVPEVPVVREAPQPLVPSAEWGVPAPSRPYIPPPEEPFDASWERAQLTAPVDAHLNRAAAGTLIALALVVILGVLAFNFRRDLGAWVIALGQTISGENRSTVPAPSAAESDTQPQPPDEPKPVLRKPEIAARTQSGPAASGGGVNPSPAASSKAPAGDANDAQNAAVNSDAAADSVNPQEFPETGNGQEEFNAASEILRGSKRLQNLSKAVNLLWASVRKGYVPAEVTLADLYRRGEGVPKNCDQVRVLLVAASRKGSPDARHMLEQMAEKGCE